MPTPREIDDEAEALYEDFREAFSARGGEMLPPWKEQRREDVRDGWLAAAVGSLKRREASVGGPIDPDPPELPGK